jgi:tetratricopeptide (TPR) repeat protein
LNEEKRFDEAEGHLLKAQAAKMIGWRAHYELGRSYYGLDRLAEAERNLRKAAESKPPYGNLYVLLANTLIRQDKLPEGLANLETFLKVAPKSPLAPTVREKVKLLNYELGRR